MPTTATRQLVLERDGYHCRFCGMPVIASWTRKAIMSVYGEGVLPWGSTFETCHAAFQCLWLQFDHILPNARGGTSDADNIAITCAPCNYGRMNFTLNEVGVSDPLARENPCDGPATNTGMAFKPSMSATAISPGQSGAKWSCRTKSWTSGQRLRIPLKWAGYSGLKWATAPT